jgi:preprotein translocase subunit YajC
MYSTATLSLIPLIMIGGLIYYLFRLSQKNSRQSDL